jgi:hypothetical protein
LPIRVAVISFDTKQFRTLTTEEIKTYMWKVS